MEFLHFNFFLVSAGLRFAQLAEELPDHAEDSVGRQYRIISAVAVLRIPRNEQIFSSRVFS
jgi:hypothetical protein